MAKWWIQSAAVVATLVLVGGAVADELAEVEKKIVAASEKIKSCTAKVTHTSNIEPQAGFSMKSEMSGTYEFVRDGQKMKLRNDMKGTTVQKIGDQETKSEGVQQMVSDGEYSYTYQEYAGQKTAMKQKLDANTQQVADKKVLEELRKSHNLKLLPEDKVEGREAYVIEATPNTPDGQYSKQTLWFCKESGMTIKTITYATDGKPMATMVLSDVKINPEIPADRFVFKAPEGVQVMDLSTMGAERP